MRIMSHGLRAGAAAFALSLLASTAQAVTCEEARGLTPTELNHWAKRLQVTPTYLAALLDKAFCVVGSDGGSVIAQGQPRRSPKSREATPTLAD